MVFGFVVPCSMIMVTCASEDEIQMMLIRQIFVYWRYRIISFFVLVLRLNILLLMITIFIPVYAPVFMLRMRLFTLLVVVDTKASPVPIVIPFTFVLRLKLFALLVVMITILSPLPSIIILSMLNSYSWVLRKQQAGDGDNWQFHDQWK